MSKTESDDPNVVTHRVIGAAGQVADLFDVETDAGMKVVAIDKDGKVILGDLLGTKYVDDVRYTPSTAITAAGSYGKVFVPKGNYVSTAINLPTGIRLCGAGKLSTVLQSSAATPLLTITSGGVLAYADIRDISLFGNSIGTIGISAARKYGNVLKDLAITQFTSHGLQIQDSVLNELLRIYSCYNGGWGMYFDNNVINGTTTWLTSPWTDYNTLGGIYSQSLGTIIQNGVFQASPVGVMLEDTSGCSIRGSHFETLTNYGIHLKNTKRSVFDANIFSGPFTAHYLEGYQVGLEFGVSYFLNGAIRFDGVGGTNEAFETWVDRSVGGHLAPNNIHFEDDFFGAALGSWWTATGSWTMMSGMVSGFVKGLTAATTDSVVILNWNNKVCFTTSRHPIFFTRMGATNETVTWDAEFGLASDGVSSANEWVGFESLNGEANWFACSSDNVGQTRTDTGIARTGIRNFKFEFPTGGSNDKIRFYINGKIVATHDTTLGAKSPRISTALQPWYQIKTKSDNAVSLIVDLCHVEYGRYAGDW